MSTLRNTREGKTVAYHGLACIVRDKRKRTRKNGGAVGSGRRSRGRNHRVHLIISVRTEKVEGQQKTYIPHPWNKFSEPDKLDRRVAIPHTALLMSSSPPNPDK